MRIQFMWLALALSACAASSTMSLTPADAATGLIVGERITMTRQASPTTGGEDPLVLFTLAHADGRSMRFEEANHAPDHLRAQGAGGPLAQVMGLFGEERPTLLIARDHQGAPFMCGTDGPVAIGLYEDSASGTVRIVGLRQEFQFEHRPDGTQRALPYSPDQVCARLAFRKG